MSQQINFRMVKTRLNNSLRVIVLQMGNEAVNFSKDNFVAQGWRDMVLNPWKPRADKSKRSSGRAILVKSARLKRSVRLVRIGARSVTIGSDVPYAAAHNDGFKGMVTVPQHTRTVGDKDVTVKSHNRRMNLPQRRFMGESRMLTNRLLRVISREVNKAFK